jgi:hypothetical protein
MTRLSNIRAVGRYLNVDTQQEVNVKKGRNLQRGTDLLFFLYRGKRQFISDRDFYGGVWKKIERR